MQNQIKWTVFMLSFIFIQTLQAQYCIPTTDCTLGDGIRQFAVGNFNNISDCEADNGIPGYGDFTSLTGLEMGQGSPESVTLISAFANNQMSMWVDFNNDIQFDSTELIMTDVPVEDGVPTITQVTIPANTPLGTYTLRLKSTWDAPSSGDACAQGDYGETEDYIVTVVPPPTCAGVSDVNASQVGDTSFELGWSVNGTETAWDIEYGQLGFAPNGTPSPGYDDVSNPVTITGLNAITSYDVYIRADCGADNTNVSTWVGPIQVTTSCGFFGVPYVENFDVFFPNCWAEADDGDLTTGPQDLGLAAWLEDGFANNGFVGAARINLFQGDIISDWLLTPVINLAAGSTYQVEFDFAINAYATNDAGVLGSDDEVHFLISTDLGSTYTSLQSWTAADNVNPAGELIIHDLSPYVGMNVMFAYWASDGMVDDLEDNDISIDNFKVRTPPSCPDLSGLTATNITSTTADISWTENGAATMWDIEFDFVDFAPSGVATAGFDNVSNPATITGLQPNSIYDVYVRADCDGNDGDVSLWIGPITLTTSCTDFVPPYLEDFTTYLPGCWNQAGEGDLITGPMDLGNSDWFADGFGNQAANGAVGSAKINLYNTSHSDWLISPSFDLSGGVYTVEFDFAITQFANDSSSNLGSDDEVHFLISNDNGQSWTSLESWKNTSNVDPMGEHIIHSLSGYVGQTVRFAFYGSDGTVDDPEDCDVFVDNFEVILDANPPALQATVAEVNTGCFGGTDASIDLEVAGGIPPYQYSWSGPNSFTSADQDISGLPGGPYTCVITDANNETTTIVEIIETPDAIALDYDVVNPSSAGASDGSIENMVISGGVAPYQMTWENGTFPGNMLVAGTYCLMVVDNNGCEFDTCIEVMDGPVGIESITSLQSFNLTPNPVGAEDLNIQINFQKEEWIQMNLLNMFGQVLLEKNYQSNTIEDVIETNELPAGVYFVRITTLNNNQMATAKFVKQ